MKHCTKRLIFFLTLVLISPLSLCVTQQMMDVYHQASVLLGAKYFDYQEKGDQPGAPVVLDSETAVIPKITVELMTHLSHLVVGGGLSLSRGQSNYDGHIQSFNEQAEYVPSKSNSKQTFSQLYLHLGWLLHSYNTLFEPFLEARWRHWHRGSMPIPTEGLNEEVVLLNGYSEVYTHYTLLAGIAFLRQLTPNWLGKLSIALGSTIDATITTDLPIGEEGVATIYSKSSLQSRLDGRVNMQFNRRLAQHVDFIMSIGYRHFRYGKSQEQFGFYEPSSKTHETTVSAGLQFGLA